VEKNQLLVIMAHPDDAELSCYGTICKYVDEGVFCSLVIATKGENVIRKDKTPLDRLNETQKAFHKTKIDISCLNIKDGNIVHDLNLMRVLKKIIQEINPTTIISHYPDEFGYEHQDHTALGKAVISCAFRYCKNLRMLLLAEPLFRGFTSFRGNHFVNVSNYYDDKKLAIKKHKSQYNKHYTNVKFLKNRLVGFSPYINSFRISNNKYEIFESIYTID